MTLQDFLSESISQVFAGLADASSRADELGGKINPHYLGQNSVTSTLGGLIEFIEFDIAVCATQSEAGKVGGGLTVAFLGMGASSTASSDLSTTSRIKFRVPVTFPRPVARSRANTAGAE